MPRPTLLAALLCERVLIEKDDVASVIRIADQVTTFTTPDTPATSLVHVPLTLFASFRALEPCGPFNLRIEAVEIAPLAGGVTIGRRLVLATTFAFTPDSLGVNVLHHLGQMLLPFGSYAIEFVMDGEVIARVPLTLIQARVPV